MNLTLKDYIQGVKNNTIKPQEVYEYYLNKAKNDPYNAYVRTIDITTVTQDGSLHQAPIALKDNIMLTGEISSCGSKMLENYTAPYTATCVKNLQKNGAKFLGMTNMDEFAMGSTTATSYFGKTLNPHGKNRFPGGSSGGSAAAVAGDLCLGALGTDTGGSVRQPAARCGIVGLKPTYRRMSRYGVQAMASSLDQVGIFTKNIEDCKILLENTMGFDPQDSQSDERADIAITRLDKKINEYTIAIPKQFLEEGLNPKIKEKILTITETLKNQGATIDIIDLPILEHGVSTYYIIQPAEASTNLARFDGIRYGLQKNTQDPEFKDIMDYITKIRTEGFGEEVKRRILLGTFVLSSSHYEGFYIKATQAREKLKQEINTIFSKYDLILSPTTPTPARKIGEKDNDPLQQYMADLYTIPANLTGIPAVSIPIGTIEDQNEDMPIGLQIMGKHRDESQVLSFAKIIETLEK